MIGAARRRSARASPRTGDAGVNAPWLAVAVAGAEEVFVSVAVCGEQPFRTDVRGGERQHLVDVGEPTAKAGSVELRVA